MQSSGKMTTQELLELFDEITTKCKNVMRAKNADYTGNDGGQPFANFEKCEWLGLCDTKIGMLVRMSDKFQRLITYTKNGKLMVEGEGFEDACMDLINYLILFMGKSIEQQRMGNVQCGPQYSKPISVAKAIKETTPIVKQEKKKKKRKFKVTSSEHALELLETPDLSEEEIMDINNQVQILIDAESDPMAKISGIPDVAVERVGFDPGSQTGFVPSPDGAEKKNLIIVESIEDFVNKKRNK